MEDCGCLVPAAVLILKVLQKWQLRDGLKGLRIGAADLSRHWQIPSPSSRQVTRSERT